MNGLKEVRPLHFLTASVVLICLIGGGFYAIGTQIGSIKANAATLIKDIDGLQDFKDAGKRFTAKDGVRLASEIKDLENKVEGYNWFKDEFIEFKGEVKELIDVVNQLQLSLFMIEFQYTELAKRLDSVKMYKNEKTNKTIRNER